MVGFVLVACNSVPFIKCLRNIYEISNGLQNAAVKRYSIYYAKRMYVNRGY